MLSNVTTSLSVEVFVCSGATAAGVCWDWANSGRLLQLAARATHEANKIRLFFMGVSGLGLSETVITMKRFGEILKAYTKK
jgi:hypothetical protein